MALVTLGLLAGCASLSSNGGAESSGGSEGMALKAEDLAGSWTSDETGQPTLTFDEAGKVSGTDGCNGIGSSYTIEHDVARIERFVSTMMACPGVDDWLRGVAEVRLSGEELTVVNSAGEEIGTLQRASSTAD